MTSLDLLRQARRSAQPGADRCQYEGPGGAQVGCASRCVDHGTGSARVRRAPALPGHRRALGLVHHDVRGADRACARWDQHLHRPVVRHVRQPEGTAGEGAGDHVATSDVQGGGSHQLRIGRRTETGQVDRRSQAQPRALTDEPVPEVVVEPGRDERRPVDDLVDEQGERTGQVGDRHGGSGPSQGLRRPRTPWPCGRTPPVDPNLSRDPPQDRCRQELAAVLSTVMLRWITGRGAAHRRRC